MKLEDLTPLHWSSHSHHQIGQGGHLCKEQVHFLQVTPNAILWKWKRPAYRRHRGTVSSCVGPPPSCTSEACASTSTLCSIQLQRICSFLLNNSIQGSGQVFFRKNLYDENPVLAAPSLPPSTFSTLNTGPYFFGFSGKKTLPGQTHMVKVVKVSLADAQKQKRREFNLRQTKKWVFISEEEENLPISGGQRSGYFVPSRGESRTTTVLTSWSYTW